MTNKIENKIETLNLLISFIKIEINSNYNKIDYNEINNLISKRNILKKQLIRIKKIELINNNGKFSR